MKVNVRLETRLGGEANLGGGTAMFTVPLPDSSDVITATIALDTREVELVGPFEVSEDLLRVLLTPADAGQAVQFTPDTEKERETIVASVKAAGRKIADVLKYYGRRTKLEDDLVPGQWLWSTDGVSWHFLPTLRSYVFDVSTAPTLNESVCSAMQKHLTERRPTLLGLRHLYRAYLEDEPRYKWIDATIAAELAIKEFLVLKRPELETLLVELPSPMLGKMYGRILKE